MDDFTSFNEITITQIRAFWEQKAKENQERTLKASKNQKQEEEERKGEEKNSIDPATQPQYDPSILLKYQELSGKYEEEQLKRQELEEEVSRLRRQVDSTHDLKTEVQQLTMQLEQSQIFAKELQSKYMSLDEDLVLIKKTSTNENNLRRISRRYRKLSVHSEEDSEYLNSPSYEIHATKPTEPNPYGLSSVSSVLPSGSKKLSVGSYGESSPQGFIGSSPPSLASTPTNSQIYESKEKYKERSTSVFELGKQEEDSENTKNDTFQPQTDKILFKSTTDTPKLTHDDIAIRRRIERSLTSVANLGDKSSRMNEDPRYIGLSVGDKKKSIAQTVFQQRSKINSNDLRNLQSQIQTHIQQHGSSPRSELSFSLPPSLSEPQESGIDSESISTSLPESVSCTFPEKKNLHEQQNQQESLQQETIEKKTQRPPPPQQRPQLVHHQKPKEEQTQGSVESLPTIESLSILHKKVVEAEDLLKYYSPNPEKLQESQNETHSFYESLIKPSISHPPTIPKRPQHFGSQTQIDFDSELQSSSVRQKSQPSSPSISPPSRRSSSSFSGSSGGSDLFFENEKIDWRERFIQSENRLIEKMQTCLEITKVWMDSSNTNKKVARQLEKKLDDLLVLHENLLTSYHTLEKEYHQLFDQYHELDQQKRYLEDLCRQILSLNQKYLPKITPSSSFSTTSSFSSMNIPSPSIPILGIQTTSSTPNFQSSFQPPPPPLSSSSSLLPASSSSQELYEVFQSLNQFLTEVAADQERSLQQNSNSNSLSNSANSRQSVRIRAETQIQDLDTLPPSMSFKLEAKCLQMLSEISATMGEKEATVIANIDITKDKRPIAYFEIKILEAPPNGIIVMGLGDPSTSTTSLPGKEESSYCYCNDGKKVNHETYEDYSTSFSCGDIIGCGMRIKTKDIFFTRNGHFLGIAYRHENSNSLFPLFGIGCFCLLSFNFGSRPFVFDLHTSFFQTHALTVVPQLRHEEHIKLFLRNRAYKTIHTRMDTTAKELCHLGAEKFMIKDWENYAIYAEKNGYEHKLGDHEKPLEIQAFWLRFLQEQVQMGNHSIDLERDGFNFLFSDTAAERPSITCYICVEDSLGKLEYIEYQIPLDSASEIDQLISKLYESCWKKSKGIKGPTNLKLEYLDNQKRTHLVSWMTPVSLLCEKAVALNAYISPLNQSETSLLAVTYPNYVLEYGQRSPEVISNETVHMTETLETINSNWYQDYFVGKLAIHFAANTPEDGPKVVSVVKEQLVNSNTILYRFVAQTRDGETRFSITHDPTIRSRSKTSMKFLPNQSEDKTILRLLRESRPTLGRGLEVVTNPKFQDDLISLVLSEKKELLQYKIGILYCKRGQVNEGEMFNNTETSEDFENFLDSIGERVVLKGFTGYRGGLNVKDNATGTHSIYSLWKNNIEIMFHVSTLLPYYPADPQQIERKRHLGNDIVMIVFQEEETPPYDVTQFSSEYTHIFIIVRIEKSHGDVSNSSGGQKWCRVNVISKNTIPPFGPLLPNPPIFSLSEPENLKEFLLNKVVNAENAAYRSVEFVNKIKKTKERLLHALLVRHSATK